jgi:hypothetical protein
LIELASGMAQVTCSLAPPLAKSYLLQVADYRLNAAKLRNNSSLQPGNLQHTSVLGQLGKQTTGLKLKKPRLFDQRVQQNTGLTAKMGPA